MRQLILFILEEESSTISKELMGKDVSIIFDGTTSLLLLRFVDEWKLKVRLVHFQLVKSSVCGDELARIMIEVLHRKLGVLQGQLLAAMRDRASVNTCALRTVSVLYPDMLDVGCISHFLDQVGVKCKTPALTLFTALCKSNANVFCRNSRLFVAFRRKNIEFSMEANLKRKVTIIREAYCFQRHEFSNDNSFGTKIDFDFSSEKSLCSINDFEHVSKISLFISSAQTFPSILLTTSCQVRSCRDDSFARSSHKGEACLFT